MAVKSKKRETELIEELRRLNSELFTGTLTDGTTDVEDYEENGYTIYTFDFFASFENFIKDGFSLENFLEYTSFLKDLAYNDELYTKGYSFGECITGGKNTNDLKEDYKGMKFEEDGEPNSISFFSLSINPKLLKLSVAEVKTVMEDTLNKCYDKYMQIKDTISFSQKKDIINRNSIKEDTIESITYTGGCNDSISYREIYTLTFPEGQKRTLKISIGTDSSNPRDGVVSVLKDNLDWVVLYSIPASLLRTEQGLKYKPNVVPTHAHKYFSVDVMRLKEKAEELLYLAIV